MSEEIMQKYYSILKSAFVGTLIKDLLPGIIHNFANPLNSIMGRGQIMKRRLDNTFASEGKEASVQYPPEFVDRLKADVESIVNESERFFNMFHVVASRFQMMENCENEIISLPRLITSELQFAEHYLDFKHQIKKDVSLNGNVPPIKGNPAYLSLCLWALLRQVVRDTRNATEKTLSIRTYMRGDGAVVEFCNSISAKNTDSDQRLTNGGTAEDLLFEIALNMLEALGVKIDMTLKSGFRRVCLILKI